MVPATVPVHRLSFDDVLRMVEAGILDEDDRIELVDGVLVEMSPIGAEHDGALAWLNGRLARVADARWEVRVQSTFLIPGGYLLPDLLLVEPMSRHQQPETALLVVEVAQTSQARDREKGLDYARAGVPDYWVADLPARTLTVRRDPTSSGYRSAQTFADGDTVTPLAPGAPPVAVTELMG